MINYVKFSSSYRLRHGLNMLGNDHELTRSPAKPRTYHAATMFGTDAHRVELFLVHLLDHAP